MLKRMFRSRKFLTLLLDTAISLVTYFVAKYVSESAGRDVLFLIGAIQPVILAVIVMWGVEDAAEKRAGTFRRD